MNKSINQRIREIKVSLSPLNILLSLRRYKKLIKILQHSTHEDLKLKIKCAL